MQVRFWGVRGSVAVSGSHVAWIGGNTSCLEIAQGEHRLILDAGTGIRALGEAMMKHPKPLRAAVLFSHLHWDHVQGFPFFAPAYVPGTELMMFGPGADGDRKLRRTLTRQMLPPSFPVTLEAMRSSKHFGSARPGVRLELGPFAVTPFELPHPNGCLGYRVEADGRSFIYATDVELSPESLSPEVARHLEGADALCLDAQYTPDEYQGIPGGASKKGWGHSTMIDAARIARLVSARRLYLFHHDPAHNDDQVEQMADRARDLFEGAEPAREGVTLNLSQAACA